MTEPPRSSRACTPSSRPGPRALEQAGLGSASNRPHFIQYSPTPTATLGMARHAHPCLDWAQQALEPCGCGPMGLQTTLAPAARASVRRIRPWKSRIRRTVGTPGGWGARIQVSGKNYPASSLEAPSLPPAVVSIVVDKVEWTFAPLIPVVQHIWYAKVGCNEPCRHERVKRRARCHNCGGRSRPVLRDHGIGEGQCVLESAVDAWKQSVEGLSVGLDNQVHLCAWMYRG